jgi:hypothetical protein
MAVRLLWLTPIQLAKLADTESAEMRVRLHQGRSAEAKALLAQAMAGIEKNLSKNSTAWREAVEVEKSVAQS